MPTIPFEEFIPSSIPPDIKKLLNEFADLIREVVNYGSQVTKWSAEKITKGDENAVAFLMFRNIFEILDSIEVLIRNSCAEPCKILLRSLFESFLNFKYLLEKDFKLRGIDFLVCYRHDEINSISRFDPENPLFAKYQEKKARDITLKDIPQKPVSDIEERIKNIRKTFDIPSYLESSAEYEKYKSEHKGKEPKNWYSLRNGPNNVYELANYLGFPAQYEILYRSWSGLVHGNDIIDGKLSIVEPGVAAFSQIRYPSAAPNVAFMAITFGWLNIRFMSEHFVPEKLKENDVWFHKEIEPRYSRLSKMKIVDHN